MKTFAALTIATLFASTSAKTIEVSAGDDFEAACLLEVEAGDTCYLAKGTYEHDGLTRVHGTEDARITITGHSEACIKGSGTQDRVLQISHDYYTIENICFDGSHGGDDYTATAIYVLGADKKSTKNGVTSSVTGLIMRNLEIKNFNSECVHFRYFVTHAEVEGCTIQNCGKEAFVNGGGGKVGEAIYLGTALDQVDDNKAPEVKLRSGSPDNVNADICRDNWIHHNTFRTYGNECVDVKEGSTNNLIEYNVCEQQKDENSGGFGFRGSENTGRYNEISNCDGAGFRVGGDKGYGEGNNMYGNVITNTDYGAFNVMSPNQGVVCGNELSDITTVLQGAEKDDFTSEDAQASCSGSLPGDIDGFSSPSPSPAPEDDDDSAADDDTGAGVNFSEDAAESGSEVFEVNSQQSGEGDCGTVLKVVAVKVQYVEFADPENDIENLLDGDLDKYYSVNRESTQITFELEDDQEVNGVSIGFFMKAAEEERIYTFDIAIRESGDDEWTTVISRKESSGDMGIMQTFTFSSKTAKYVRFESHGNTFNNWTALTEFEVCAEAGYESNSKFPGMKTAEKELQKLADAEDDDEVCGGSEKLSAVNVKSDGPEHLSVIFDGNFETRWSTSNTQNSDDLDNDKIRLRFLGDQSIHKVKIAFFDGHLAKPHFSLYKQKAGATTWSVILDHEIAEKTESFQTFVINETGVNKLYIVGNGNDIGDYTKVSEVEVYGC